MKNYGIFLLSLFTLFLPCELGMADAKASALRKAKEPVSFVSQWQSQNLNPDISESLNSD